MHILHLSVARQIDLNEFHVHGLSSQTTKTVQKRRFILSTDINVTEVSVTSMPRRCFCEDWYQTIRWITWIYGLCYLSRSKVTWWNESENVNMVPQQDANYISTPAICISHIRWVAGDKNCVKFSKRGSLVELSCRSKYIRLSL